MTVVRHRYVYDGEHHEDIGLQDDDQDVKYRPAQAQQGGERGTNEAGRRIIQSSRKMISPAYMLPNSRSECDSGLEMYSTRLNSTLKHISSGASHAA